MSVRPTSPLPRPLHCGKGAAQEPFLGMPYRCKLVQRKGETTNEQSLNVRTRRILVIF